MDCKNQVSSLTFDIQNFSTAAYLSKETTSLVRLPIGPRNVDDNLWDFGLDNIWSITGHLAIAAILKIAKSLLFSN